MFWRGLVHLNSVSKIEFGDRNKASRSVFRPNKVPVGRFKVSMNLKDTSKSFKLLTVGFESSTMALINLTTFGVAVGATVLEVKVEVEDR